MEIIISHSNLNQYTDEHYFQVESVIWHINHLIPKILSKFPNLKKLDCSEVNLTTLEYLPNLINLEVLICNDNALKNLCGIDKLINLKYLNCSGNKIEKILLYQNTKLIQLDCSSNYLSTLQGIDNCINLKDLNCQCNQLTSLNYLNQNVKTNRTKLL